MPQVDASGRIIPDAVGAATSLKQNISGSPLQAAADKTMASAASEADAARALGAGQKAGKRTYRGGNNNAVIPKLPTANSIPGISTEKVFLDGGNLLAQLKADAAGDSLGNAPPVQMGRGKSRRRVNGIRRKRTHRRKHHRHSSRRSRVRRVHSRRH